MKVEVKVTGVEVVMAVLNVVASAVVVVSVGSSVVAVLVGSLDVVKVSVGSLDVAEVSVGSSVVVEVSVGSSEVVEVLVGFAEVLEVLDPSPSVHSHQFWSGFNTSALPSQVLATQSADPLTIFLRVFDRQTHSGSPSSQRL